MVGFLHSIFITISCVCNVLATDNMIYYEFRLLTVKWGYLDYTKVLLATIYSKVYPICLANINVF